MDGWMDGIHLLPLIRTTSGHGLQGNRNLSEEEKEEVTRLAVSWDLPGFSEQHRKWLFNRLLQHAVLDRTKCQVKQRRRGIKETKVWSLITAREDGVSAFHYYTPSSMAASRRAITPRLVSHSQLDKPFIYLFTKIKDNYLRVQFIYLFIFLLG
ncbi:hypothetical protein Q7C36_014686 [Tachysurus vachellii]|uniref:Uncharacterized protein n=1 Tax=Tachysurus vachellii TaxID=175792 RepID=A0AA88SGI3_TACVA|nr:hypothetical protein Q7C36_014686 [Tachysurus vachellii]